MAAATDKFKKLSRRWVGQIGSGGVSDNITQTIPLSSATNLPNDTAVVAVIDRVDANGVSTPGKEESVIGVVSGSNLIDCVRGAEGTAQAHNSGAVVEILFTAKGWNDLIDGLLVSLNQDGSIASGVTIQSPTLSNTVLNGSVSGTAILDEDDMASDSATKVPSQQSVKAYVDASGSADGWLAITDTLTYASATSFTIAGVDRTAVYTKGTRIKLTQTSTKYFVVTGSSFSTNTTVTVTGGTDYTLANAAITLPFYSYQANPQGYPTTFNYTPTLTGFSSNPTDVIGHFSVIGNECSVVVDDSGNGTSNSTGKTWSLPITSAGYAGSINVAINNGSQAMANHIVDPTETVVNSYLAPSGTFTNSGGCRLFPNGLRLTYKF